MLPLFTLNMLAYHSRWYKSMNRAVLQSSVSDLVLLCFANTLEIVEVLDWIWARFVHGPMWKNEARWHDDYLLALLQLHDLAVAANTVQETQPWTLTTDGIFTQLACAPVCNTDTQTEHSCTLVTLSAVRPAALSWTRDFKFSESLTAVNAAPSYCFIFATILPETLCW